MTNNKAQNLNTLANDLDHVAAVLIKNLAQIRLAFNECLNSPDDLRELNALSAFSRWGKEKGLKGWPEDKATDALSEVAVLPGAKWLKTSDLKTVVEETWSTAIDRLLAMGAIAYSLGTYYREKADPNSVINLRETDYRRAAKYADLLNTEIKSGVRMLDWQDTNNLQNLLKAFKSQVELGPLMPTFRNDATVIERMLVYRVARSFLEVFNKHHIKVVTKIATAVRYYPDEANLRDTVFRAELQLAEEQLYKVTVAAKKAED